MNPIPLRFPAAILLFAASAAAQLTAEGYASSVQSLPATAQVAAVLPTGMAWFDGSDLMLQANGQQPRSLLHFAAPRFGSFVLPIGDALLFAESSNDEVWLAPLAIGTPARLLGIVPLAYDAAPLGSGRAVLSARTGGFAANRNDILAIDLATGATTNLGNIFGASGPIAVDRGGNLLLATAPLSFPPPAGSVEIVRWSPTQWVQALVGGPQLDRTTATLVVNGIDTAGDLAADGDDDVLFTDWLNSKVVECSDVHAGATMTMLADYGTAAVTPMTLQFLDNGGAGTFEAFATDAGPRLVVLETDFATATQVRLVAPKAASLGTLPAGPIAAGPFAMTLRDFPAAGVGLLAIGLLRTDIAVPMRFPGFEQTVAWDAGLLYPTVDAVVFLDAAGRGAAQLQNPGFPAGLAVHAQALFVDAAFTVVGSTAPLTIQLGP